MTSQFLAYDEGYTGGVVAVDRVGRGRRGRRQEHRHRPARRRRHGAGVVERVAARRAAEHVPGQPQPSRRRRQVPPDRVVRTVPAGGGVTVATTSTTSGADLLVSGSGPDRAELQKLALARPDPAATTVDPEGDRGATAARRAAAIRRHLAVSNASRQMPEDPGDEVEHHSPEGKGGNGNADAAPVGA